MRTKWILGISLLVIGMMALAAIPVTDADPVPQLSSQYTIQIAQDGSDAAISISPSTSAQILWDFDDGTYGSGTRVQHTYAPGMYNIKAVISGATSQIVTRNIGVYSEGPVTEIQKNAEYRYAVYNGADSKLVVKDSDNRVVSWLSYDAQHRIVTGVPRETGTYTATLTGDRTITWTITVSDGILQDPWVRFDAHAADGKVVLDGLYLSSNSLSNRYTWTLSNLDGSLVSLNEGGVPNVSASPGLYKLSLSMQSVSGSASYSQLIIIDGQPAAPADTFDAGSLWIVFVVIGIVSGLFFFSTRDPRALLGVVLSIIALAVVIL